MNATDLAKRAYNAYGDEAGWVTYDKKKMPTWEALTVKVRNNWRASVVETAKLLGHEVIFDRE